MADKTTNYNLIKPLENETADIAVINQNMDTIDDKMKSIETAAIQVHLAKDIAIEDTEGLFAATEVEGALSELFTDVSNGKTSIASAITDMGQSANGSDTFTNLATKVRNISIDADANSAEVLAAKTFYQGGTKKTGTMPNQGGILITPGTSDQGIPAGYHDGFGYVAGDANLIPGNVRIGASIFGVAGTFDPSPIKSIQYGVIDMPASTGSVTITISSVDISESIVLLSFADTYSNQDGVHSIAHRGRLISNTQLVIDRYDQYSATTASIAWKVIEFSNIASLQRGTVHLEQNTELPVSVSTVNPNKAMLFCSFMFNASSNYAAYTAIRHRVINSTTIGFYNKYYQSGYGYNADIQWYLAEFK